MIPSIRAAKNKTAEQDAAEQQMGPLCFQTVVVVREPIP